jgi:hypothetical protein
VYKFTFTSPDPLSPDSCYHRRGPMFGLSLKSVTFVSRFTRRSGLGSAAARAALWHISEESCVLEATAGVAEDQRRKGAMAVFQTGWRALRNDCCSLRRCKAKLAAPVSSGKAPWRHYVTSKTAGIETARKAKTHVTADRHDHGTLSGLAAPTASALHAVAYYAAYSMNAVREPQITDSTILMVASGPVRVSLYAAANQVIVGWESHGDGTMTIRCVPPLVLRNSSGGPASSGSADSLAIGPRGGGSASPALQRVIRTEAL